MIVTFFRGARDATPSPIETTWPDFANLLKSWSEERAEQDCLPCAGKECPSKLAGMAFSPCRYADGATRGKASVLDVHAFAGDLDHLTREQVATAREALSGLAHALYSTHNHLRGGEDDWCLRVVIPLSRPVPAADWRRFWLAFAELSGLPLDKVVKSTASLLFMPSRPRGAAHVLEIAEGDPLDVDAVLEHAAPAESAPPPSPREDVLRDLGGIAPTEIDADARKTLISLGKIARTLAPGGAYGPQGVGRRMTLYNAGRLIGGLAAAGRVHLDEALELVERLCDPPLTPGGACEKALRDGALVGEEAPLATDPGPGIVAEARGLPAPEVRYPLKPWTWTQLEAVCRGAPDDAVPIRPRSREIGTKGDEDPQTTLSDDATLKGDAAEAGGFVLERYWDRESLTPTLRRWRGAWYHWSRAEGCYRELDAEVLFAQILRSDSSEGDVTDAGKVLKALVAYPGVHVADRVELGSWLRGGDRCDPLDTAACVNGLLCVATGEVTPASPLYFSTTCLSVAHDPAAPSPARWLAFLAECFEGDTEAVTLLQEWFGYCLTPDTRQQKMLFMIGKKRSGKGTILNVLGALLGETNVASPSLASLNGEFGLWQLIGKTAAFFPDVRHSQKTDSTRMIEALLSVTGGDRVSVNRKKLAFWHGRIGARIALATNALPDMRDSSDALVSRMMVLDMPASFFGREDKDLARQLYAEVPGILLWAIAGWKSLRARGAFAQPKSSASAVATLNDLSSPVGAWLSECCSTDPSESKDANVPGVRCEEAFQAYRQWCVKGEHRVENVTRFGADVKARGHERTRFGPRGDRVWRYPSLYLRMP